MREIIFYHKLTFVPMSASPHVFQRMIVLAGFAVTLCGVAGSSDELRGIVARTNTERLAVLLKSNPALANHVLDNGVPFLVYAANSGRAGIVELLVRDRVCLQSHLDLALNGASDQGHQEVVRVLLDNGANANFDPEDDGVTPLHNAALLRNATIAWMLLRAGADPRAVDSDGRTPLHWCKNPVTAELLVKAGADINAVDSKGYNVLHVFATPREIIDSETVRYLIEEGIDVNAKDNSGLTPLELAKQSEQDELIDALIKHAGKRQPRKHDKVSDQEKKSEN